MPRTRFMAIVNLAIATVMTIAPTQAQAQRPAKPGGEKYALLVGVGKYDPDELRSLPFAETDVVGLARGAQRQRLPARQRRRCMTQAAAAPSSGSCPFGRTSARS